DRAVFWSVRTLAKHLVEDNRGGEYEWREQLRGMSDVPFFVVDDAGGRVLVEVRGALLVTLAQQNVSEHPRVNDDNRFFDVFLRRHGVVPTAYMGIAGDTRFFEACLRPGDPVSVFGRIDESAEVRNDGYRDAPARILRLFSPTADAPVVISPTP